MRRMVIFNYPNNVEGIDSDYHNYVKIDCSLFRIIVYHGCISSDLTTRPISAPEVGIGIKTVANKSGAMAAIGQLVSIGIFQLVILYDGYKNRRYSPQWFINALMPCPGNELNRWMIRPWHENAFRITAPLCVGNPHPWLVMRCFNAFFGVSLKTLFWSTIALIWRHFN